MTRVKTIMWKDRVYAYFEVKCTLHYGSALSPFCFHNYHRYVSEEAGTKPAWVIVFTDDSVLVSGTVEEVKGELERCMERRDR